VGHVSEADLSERPFKVKVEEEWVQTRTLIIATGASARWLGLPNETEAHRTRREFVRDLRRGFL